MASAMAQFHPAMPRYNRSARARQQDRSQKIENRPSVKYSVPTLAQAISKHGFLFFITTCRTLCRAENRASPGKAFRSIGIADDRSNQSISNTAANRSSRCIGADANLVGILIAVCQVVPIGAIIDILHVYNQPAIIKRIGAHTTTKNNNHKHNDNSTSHLQFSTHDDRRRTGIGPLNHHAEATRRSRLFAGPDDQSGPFKGLLYLASNPALRASASGSG